MSRGWEYSSKRGDAFWDKTYPGKGKGRVIKGLWNYKWIAFLGGVNDYGKPTLIFFEEHWSDTLNEAQQNCDKVFELIDE